MQCNKELSQNSLILTVYTYNCTRFTTTGLLRNLQYNIIPWPFYTTYKQNNNQ